jgi:hypothetical protein
LSLECVPIEHKNHPGLIELVLEYDPMAVDDIEYKNLTKEACLIAVRNYSKSFSSIPFAFVDYELCLEAVKGGVKIYNKIPLQYRDQKMARTLIEFHPEAIQILPVKLIDLDILELVVNNDYHHLGMLHLCGEHASVGRVIVDNLDRLINIEPLIVTILPGSLITNEDILKAIALNPKVFVIFNSKKKITDIRFLINSVERGVDFDVIPCEHLSMDVLLGLVRNRPNMIDNIPRKYLSDILYIEAINAHNYDHSTIDPQYMTHKLENFIAERVPGSTQSYNKEIEQLSQEIEQFVLNQ